MHARVRVRHVRGNADGLQLRSRTDGTSRAYLRPAVELRAICSRYCSRLCRLGLVGHRRRLVLCGVGLTVAFGAMVLVPFTILGHEAMASYGDSWYVKWISYSLILGTNLLPSTSSPLPM